jgi:PAS domain S-box-containing protein
MKEERMELKTIDELKEKIQFYEAVLDTMRNGVMITDPEGKIVFFNKNYGKFFGINPQDLIGKHCREVVDNTRMHIVAKTGIAEINHIQKIRGENRIVQRIPIEKDGKIIGVFGQIMFKDVQDVLALARKISVLESKVELYEKELESLRSSKYTIKDIVGESDKINEVKELAMKASLTNSPVLLIGESGTGKELFAHAIHYASERRPFPFIRLNCAAIPKDLLEAELFGYEPGAFTGAGSKVKPGKFELAHRGTIFMDEISDLPLEMQPKLLRVLEEKEVERIGGNRVTKVDFRLIAASGDSLIKCVEQGKFRKDLFYRLNVIPIAIPPLRERSKDIPLIACHLVKKINKEMGVHVTEISPEVLKAFESYYWPGNVRELANVLERVLSTIDNNIIKIHHLPIFFQTKVGESPKAPSADLKRLKEDMEKEALLHAMRVSNNNKNRAAKMLGIHRTALYKKIRKFNLSQEIE